MIAKCVQLTIGSQECKINIQSAYFSSLALHLNYFKWLLSLNNSSMQNCKSLVLHTDTHDISTIKQINLKFYVCVIIILEWEVDQWENISLSPNDISWRLNSMHWADFKCSKHEAWTYLPQKLEHCSKIMQNFPSNWLIKECRENRLPRKSQFLNIISGKTKPVVLQTLCLYSWSNKAHGSASHGALDAKSCKSYTRKTVGRVSS